MPLISETNIWFAKNQLEICREYSKENISNYFV
jgi:hypothetical protein